MTRTLATVLGLLGLAAAIYLVLVQGAAEPPLKGATGLPNLDAWLFGIAIAAVSILALSTAIRRTDAEPDHHLSR